MYVNSYNREEVHVRNTFIIISKKVILGDFG